MYCGPAKKSGEKHLNTREFWDYSHVFSEINTRDFLQFPKGKPLKNTVLEDMSAKAPLGFNGHNERKIRFFSYVCLRILLFSGKELCKHILVYTYYISN